MIIGTIVIIFIIKHNIIINIIICNPNGSIFKIKCPYYLKVQQIIVCSFRIESYERIVNLVMLDNFAKEERREDELNREDGEEWKEGKMGYGERERE